MARTRSALSVDMIGNLAKKGISASHVIPESVPDTIYAIVMPFDFRGNREKSWRLADAGKQRDNSFHSH